MESNRKRPKVYKELNLGEKVDLLRFLNNHSERATAEHFGISKTTVNNIKKRKAEYMERFENENQTMKRKFIKTAYEDVNNATFIWFKKMRSINARISGPMIKEAALTFAAKLNRQDFKASSGWLSKFNKRHGISQKILCGESNEVPEEVVADFKEKFNVLSEEFDENDIFNADELGLFFKAMPDKSLVLKGDACKSGKMSKERFTVLLAASMSGEKLKPFVIGKSQKPRAFRNFKNLSELPVIWRNNKSAWMTITLFEEWLGIVNNEMKSKHRKILLFIDNCPAHTVTIELSNITLKFLPPNATSRIQPLDQGVIKNFKEYYRAELLKSVLAASIESNVTEFSSKINALDAVQWITIAWKNVKTATIMKCFKKAGFVLRNHETESVSIDDVEDNVNVINGTDIQEYASVDDALTVCEVVQEETIFDDIVFHIKAPSLDSTEHQNISESESEEENCISTTLPNSNEIIIMVKKLKEFSVQKCPEMLQPLMETEAVHNQFLLMNSEKSRQVTLETFFKTSATKN